MFIAFEESCLPVLANRILYRTRQFWRLAMAPGKPLPSEQMAPYLSPAQLALFLSMSPGEQHHALAVLQHLLAGGHHHPALLTAALLHDVGKILCPLSVWERTIVVVGQWLGGKRWAEWAEEKSGCWRRPFLVAARHAEWGAQLATASGASSLTIRLIRYHHTPPAQAPARLASLLTALQEADNSN